ncbi:MAG: heavy-metal-associated domain-containing protein [Phycicoccus sp.]
MTPKSDTVATYSVTGMTCGHCATSVSEEAREISGVTDVSVDVPTGAVTITSTEPLARDAVEAAVVAAGYRLA